MADTAEILVQKYRKRLATLQNERAEYIPAWKDIRDFIDPRTARFPGEKVNNGTRQDAQIINSSTRLAARVLPAGMQSGITSPMRPWFTFGLPDPDMQEFRPFKEWLNLCERRMRDIFSRSNIYDRTKGNYRSLGNYGTGALFVDEDVDDVIRGHDLLMGSYTIATDASGRVTTLYHETTLTADQLQERKNERGWKISPQMQTAYDNGNYEQRFDLCHIVEPNRMYRQGSSLSQYKRFASVWLDMARDGRDAILSYKGYDENPALISRWDVVGEDSWGVGCGDVAIGDSKGMQLLEKRGYQIIDHIARPTMIADASMRNQRVSNLPGDTTYVNGLISGRPGYQPAYQIQRPSLDVIETKSQRIEARINEAYYKDLFRSVIEIGDQPNITAYQIRAIKEEKLMMLGPVLERLNDELFDPLIDRTFNIMMRRGLLPRPPEEIQGMPIKVEYISLLAQAQKAIGIGNIERLIGFTTDLAARTQSQEPIDKLNLDEIIDEYADGVATPAKLVRSNEEAQSMRDARAEQEAQAQQAQAAMNTVQSGATAADAAKTMSETNLEGDNALTRALGIA